MKIEIDFEIGQEVFLTIGVTVEKMFVRGVSITTNHATFFADSKLKQENFFNVNYYLSINKQETTFENFIQKEAKFLFASKEELINSL